jgi:hypothetical protein
MVNWLRILMTKLGILICGREKNSNIWMVLMRPHKNERDRPSKILIMVTEATAVVDVFPVTDPNT